MFRSWQDIRERAALIKSHGKLRRFWTKNRDARALGYLVEEIGNSILDRIAVRRFSGDHDDSNLTLLQTQGILVIPLRIHLEAPLPRTLSFKDHKSFVDRI